MYNEKLMCTAYKCDHYISHERDALIFTIHFEGKRGFDSESAEAAGPYFLLKNQESLEYYNLRYGGQSIQRFKKKTDDLLIYHAYVILFSIIALQWVLLL